MILKIKYRMIKIWIWCKPYQLNHLWLNYYKLDLLNALLTSCILLKNNFGTKNWPYFISEISLTYSTPKFPILQRNKVPKWLSKVIYNNLSKISKVHKEYLGSHFKMTYLMLFWYKHTEKAPNMKTI